MSTDYKIGIVVGLVVLIGGIVYFLMNGEGDQPAPPVPAPTTGPNQVVDTSSDTPSEVVTPTEVPLDTLAPRTQPTDVATPAETPTTPAATEWQLDRDAEETPSSPATPLETTDSGVVRIRIAPDTDEGGFELSEDADSAWNEPDPEPVIRTIQRPTETETAAPVGAGGGTYVVKKGDNGFWIIAQRVYGPDKGKYWTLIQRANPTADTNALREGQMLKIPSLPVGATQPQRVSSTATRADFGRATPGTGGNRIYVVAEGEAGLWGVAEKMYNGKGYLWEHIQRANPNVRPSALRPGMKLIIPPLPTTATRPGGATASRTPTTTPGGAAKRRGEIFTENGRRYYLVKSGDKGYWGIARKVYGDGKYSYLIDRANTGVDSYSLQPGDKLEVPPIPATTGRRTSPLRPARPTPAPRQGEPDFGP